MTLDDRIRYAQLIVEAKALIEDSKKMLLTLHAVPWYQVRVRRDIIKRLQANVEYTDAVQRKAKEIADANPAVRIASIYSQP